MQLLTNEFLSKYSKNGNLSELGEFVYLRTYSRYLKEEKRREHWIETVLRTTMYSINLGIKHKEKMGIKVDLEEERKEAEKLFDNLYNLKTFSSGRTLYMGGTDIVNEYPLSNYNCSFTNVQTFEDFSEVFYLLMLGSGVGVKIKKEFVDNLPKVKEVNVEHIYNEGLSLITPKEEKESTSTYEYKNDFVIMVGDSKEGWCDAIREYFKVLESDKTYEKIVLDYSYVRAEGERLLRFGGRASGYKSLEKMFKKITKVVNNAAKNNEGKFKTIDVLDIATIISENVVSGGVRRSAMIVLCEDGDTDIINAKKNIWTVKDGIWTQNEELSHRTMSNNSILFNENPSLEKIKEIIESIKVNGEPGWINEKAAKKRKPTFEGCNPCGEILLESKGCCNLSTNNVMAFVKDGKLDVEEFKESLRLATRLTIRMTLVDAEMDNWNEVMQRDRIIGISLTGIMDMVNATKMTYKELGELLKDLREVVHMEGHLYSKELKINAPHLMTTIKPEGSLSTLPNVSSGIHFSHSEYYIRRVRISATDPLFKTIEKDNCYPIFNEDKDGKIKVVEFPIKAPKGKTKYDVGAIEQLELYKLTMENWTDHNTSITVHVRENEWEDVANWIHQNFDCIIGITLLPLFEETYPLLPYERTTKEDYLERKSKVKPINYDLLKEFETEEENEILESDCEGGVCPVR